MNLNKMGIHVKRSIDGFLNTLFGIVTKSEQRQRLLKEVKLTEKARFNKQVEKTLVEAEVKKSQAILFIRNLQNR